MVRGSAQLWERVCSDRELVDRAREAVAALAGGTPDQVVFTGSATEANNANLRVQQELVRMQGIFEELQAAISFVEEERDELRLEVMRYREAERQEVRAKSQAEFAAVRAATSRPPPKKRESSD